MRRADPTIERPGVRPYFTAQVGDGEIHTYRVPMPSQLHELRDRLKALEGREDVAAHEEEQGLVIAAFWADGTWLLDSAQDDGQAVYRELYDAGWSIAEIRALFVGLCEVAAQEPTAEEVRTRVDFSWRREPKSGQPSTSERSTSETPSPSSD